MSNIIVALTDSVSMEYPDSKNNTARFRCPSFDLTELDRAVCLKMPHPKSALYKEVHKQATDKVKPCSFHFITITITTEYVGQGLK